MARYKWTLFITAKAWLMGVPEMDIHVGPQNMLATRGNVRKLNQRTFIRKPEVLGNNQKVIEVKI